MTTDHNQTFDNDITKHQTKAKDENQSNNIHIRNTYFMAEVDLPETVDVS